MRFSELYKTLINHLTLSTGFILYFLWTDTLKFGGHYSQRVEVLKLAWTSSTAEVGIATWNTIRSDFKGKGSE
jgi:hypothetical protein